MLKICAHDAAQVVPNMRCIQCPYSFVVRSRLRWQDLPWLLLLHRPFRCDSCGVRFWRFRFATQVATVGSLCR
jgi:hypothetical protein